MTHNRLTIASTMAQNHEICCRCGKGERREDTAQGLWKGYTEKAASATAPNRGFCCRCGNGRRKEDAAQGPVERAHGESGLRNGTESRVLLPLWKGGTEERCRTRACREGIRRKWPLQRHRIAEFAAVVERRTDNVAGKSRRMADNVVQMIFVTFGA